MLLLLVLLAWAAPAWAQPLPVVLNEVYYDAPGADGGAQFVELYNRSFQAVPLAGWRLEAGDGAGDARWRLLWTGQAGDVVPPRGRFTIGEGNVLPRPDRVQTVDLENGPDAVRLTAPEGAQDVIGYGALTYASYFEGRPAEDVPAGYSLARAIDGGDSNDNAADFLALSPPTPGAPNRPEIDLALTGGAADAERLEPGDVVTLRARLFNRGLGAIAAHEIGVQLWAQARPPETQAQAGGGEPGTDSLVAWLTPADDLDPGDSLDVALSFTPPHPGAWDAALQVRTLDDGVAGNDRASARLQVGPGALLVHEVMSAPEDGPEWVELRNVSPEAVALFDWTLEDATGHRATVGGPGFAFDVAPDSLVVLCADPVELLGRHPELTATRVAACTPWPALNNTASGAIPADRVIVRAPGGRVSDAMELPGGDPEGTSLERRAVLAASRLRSTWGASAVRGGTPGRANSIDAGAFVPGVALVAGIARPRAGEGALLTFRTGFERAHVSLAVYDLRGRLVRALLEDEDGPGRAGIAWDGRGPGGEAVAPGVYVAGLTARDAGGGTGVARARACVVVR